MKKIVDKVTKKVNRNRLTIEIETKLKDYFLQESKILTEEEVLNIANQEHEVVKLLSRPQHEVGNYTNSNTKLKGTWVFQIKTKKPSTKPSIRGKISKIAKDLNAKREEEE